MSPIPPRPPIVRERRVEVTIIEFRCEWCGQWFEPPNRMTRFCRASHRVNAHNERRRLGISKHKIRSVRWLDGKRVDLPPDIASARDGPIAWVGRDFSEEGTRTIPQRFMRGPAPSAKQVGRRRVARGSGGGA